MARHDAHYFLNIGLLSVFLMAIVSVVAMVALVSHGSALPSGTRIVSAADGATDNLAGAARTADLRKRPITETVTCVFEGSRSNSWCMGIDYSDISINGTCRGVQSCDAKVPSYAQVFEKGSTLIWTSNCGGTAKTVLDGKDEVVTFTCAAPEPVKFRFDYLGAQDLLHFTRLADNLEVTVTMGADFKGELISQGYDYPLYVTPSAWPPKVIVVIDTNRDGTYETQVMDGQEFTLY